MYNVSHCKDPFEHIKLHYKHYIQMHYIRTSPCIGSRDILCAVWSVVCSCAFVLVRHAGLLFLKPHLGMSGGGEPLGQWKFRPFCRMSCFMLLLYTHTTWEHTHTTTGFFTLFKACNLTYSLTVSNRAGVANSTPRGLVSCRFQMCP